MVINTENSVRNFKDLHAWRKGHELVLGIYKATQSFPATKQFGLVNQLRRAAVSITSNLAEGFNRQTIADKIHFYHMSLGSCAEVQSQLTIATDLGWLDEDTSNDLESRGIVVHKLLNGLIKSQRAKS